MKLYVANCTRQVCDFHYRVEENKGVRQQKIQPGQQIILADQSLSQREVDFILEQHHRYGMTPVSEINNINGYVPRIYSIDKPVSIKVIDDVMRRNNGVLVVRGREARKLAAVQASNVIEDTMQGIAEQTNGAISPKLNELEITVEQISDAKAPFVPSDESDSMFEEGIKITRDAGPKPETTNRKSRGRTLNKRVA